MSASLQQEIPYYVNLEIDIPAEQGLPNQASLKFLRSAEQSGAPMATIIPTASQRPWKGLIISLCILALAFGIYRYCINCEPNLPPLDRDCTRIPWTDRDADFCGRMYEGVFLPVDSLHFTIDSELKHDPKEEDGQD